MSIDENTRGRRVGRLLRMGVSRGEGSSPAEMALEELEMELALLREENARLKVERHRPPDAGRVIERMRHLGGDGGGEGGQPAAASAIEDCRAMRDGLLDACHEVQLAMQGIRGRLGELAVDLQDGVGVGERAVSAERVRSTESPEFADRTRVAESIATARVAVPNTNTNTESLDAELAEV
jgi:hypothetical protein